MLNGGAGLTCPPSGRDFTETGLHRPTPLSRRKSILRLLLCLMQKATSRGAAKKSSKLWGGKLEMQRVWE